MAPPRARSRGQVNREQRLFSRRSILVAQSVETVYNFRPLRSRPLIRPGRQFPFGTDTTIDRCVLHHPPNILWSSLVFSLDNFSSCSDTSLPDSGTRSLAFPSSAGERTGRLTGFSQKLGGDLSSWWAYPPWRSCSMRRGSIELASAGLFHSFSYGSQRGRAINA